MRGEIKRQRPNWIEIDLDALTANIAALRTLAPKGQFLLPVKADAYGHGILACSFAAQRAGVDYLGVAHLFEGIPLRQYGYEGPILVLGPLLEQDFADTVHHNLIPTLVDLQTAQAFDRWLQSQGLRSAVHLKFDTGMSRYGFPWDQDHSPFFELKNMDIIGAMTHMACSEDPDAPSNQLQMERWKSVVESLPASVQILHYANSGATMLWQDAPAHMIRPGLATYGYNPLDPLPSVVDLRPVLSLHSTVRQVREVQTGEGLSYGHRHKAQAPMRVAAIAIGYGDGIFRTQQSDMLVVIRDQVFPVIGTVCMDTCLVNITGCESIKVGDHVHVIDGELHPAIRLEAVAARSGTIPYELSCAMARRLYRLYRVDGELCRWDEAKEILGIRPPAFTLDF